MSSTNSKRRAASPPDTTTGPKRSRISTSDTAEENIADGNESRNAPVTTHSDAGAPFYPEHYTSGSFFPLLYIYTSFCIIVRHRILSQRCLKNRLTRYKKHQNTAAGIIYSPDPTVHESLEELDVDQLLCVTSSTSKSGTSTVNPNAHMAKRSTSSGSLHDGKLRKASGEQARERLGSYFAGILGLSPTFSLSDPFIISRVV